MKYNFDKITDRKHTNSVKWDVKDNELPMWVADMDFEVLPEIKEAIIKKAQVDAYGYSVIPDEFYQAIISWWEKRHHIKFEKEWMIYSTGVVASISSIVRRLTNEGDYVIAMPPVYNIFYSSIEHNNRILLANNLINNDGNYSIDFVDLENKMKEERCKLLILCNPHNPTGTPWSKEDLARIGQLAKENHVVVLSDEIHCDLIDPSYEYVPFASVNEINKDISITCLSASKAFNVAGIQSAVTIVPNEQLRKIVAKGINDDEIGEANFFASEVNIAAFTKGEQWITELNEYLLSNKNYVRHFIKDNNLKLKVCSGPATYLLWIDVSSYCDNSDTFADELRNQTGLFVSKGSVYRGDGHKFIRLNVATNLENVQKACRNLFNFIKNNY